MLFPSLFVRVGLIAVLIVLIDAHVSSGDEPKPIKPVSTFTLSDTGTAVAFSPDGRTIAVGFEHGRIDLISTESGKPLFSLESKRYWPARMKFSDDGQTLFCKSGGGLFDGRCKFDAWRLKDRKLLTDSLRGADVADNADVIRDAGDGDLSPDGNTMLLGCYRTSMAAIDLVAGRIAHLNPEFPTLRPWPLSVEFFPDGKQIAIVARDFANDAGYSDDPDSLVVLSFPELRLKSSNPLNSRRRYRGLLAGKPMSTSSHDQTYRLYDMATGKMIVDTQLAWDIVDEVAMSRDGKRVAVAFGGTPDPSFRRARIVNLEKSPSLLDCECHSVTSMAFSRDGMLLAITSKNKSLTLWKTEWSGK